MYSGMYLINNLTLSSIWIPPINVILPSIIIILSKIINFS